MPWKEQSKTMKREEFVKRMLAQDASKSALCREYGISRPTGDKLVARYLNESTLEDKSRKPISNKRGLSTLNKNGVVGSSRWLHSYF